MFTYVGRLIRGLWRRPLFNSLLFLLLALGSTAFGTVFVLVNATALRPLPFRDADRLYNLSSLEPAGPGRTTQFASSAIQVGRWRETATAFDGIEAYTPTNPKLSGDGEPESLRGASVSAGLFDMMGATPALGRIFLASEDTPGSDVVILGDGFWRRRFGADSSIIGRRIIVDDVSRTVVGVMRPSFTLFFREGDIWMPLAFNQQQLSSPTFRVLATVAHLRAGATLEQATAQIRTANEQLAADYPRAYKSTQPQIIPIRTQLLGPQRSTILLLLGAVALLFLIASANAMNLTFADSIARRTTTLTRLVLGASRRSIIRLRVTETVVIGVAAGVAAAALGVVTLALLKSINPAAFAGMGTVAFEPGTVMMTLVMSTVAALAIAFPVAAVEARGNFSELAGTITKSVGNRADRRRRSALLTIQVAVTLLLVCGTTFLVRNVRSLLSVSPGFEPAHVLVVPMTISTRSYPTPPEKANHVARMLEAVRALPGVQAASTIQSRFVLAETMNAPFDVQEVPDPNGQSPLANIRHTAPDLVKTLGMRLVRGRAIDESDRIGAPLVAMVNESFAKAYLPGVDAVGKHMRRASPPPGQWMEIVGVVADVMDAGLGFPVGPTFYVSYLQQNTPSARVTLLVRTAGDPGAQTRAVRDAIWSTDRNQIIESISPMDDLLSDSAARPKFQALVTAFFSVVALFLALVGIYIVTLHDVLNLSRELGVRAALGARTSDLLLLTLRGTLFPVTLGSALGAIGVVPLVMWMNRSPAAGSTGFVLSDVLLLLAVAAMLVGGAALVALIAGRRVARIDPAISMRST